MLELCEALYKLDEIPTGDPYGGSAQQARVRSAARNLTENLGDAGGGITAFMAGEIYPMVEIVDYPERFVAEEPAAIICAKRPATGCASVSC